MIVRFKRERKGMVALRKESVDRNITDKTFFFIRIGRSPQGERG